MAINYTWDVSEVEVYPNLDGNENVVYMVHWKLHAEDDANQDSKGRNLKDTELGVIHLDTSNITEFVAFESLDYETVKVWVENAIGTHNVTMFKENLKKKLAKQITPETISKQLSF